MIIFSLVAMTGLEKCCITSAYLQWQCHSGERPVARGPLVFFIILLFIGLKLSHCDTCQNQGHRLRIFQKQNVQYQASYPVWLQALLSHLLNMGDLGVQVSIRSYICQYLPWVCCESNSLTVLY